MEKTLVHESLVLVRTFTVVPKKVWRQAMSEAPVLPRAASSSELD